MKQLLLSKNISEGETAVDLGWDAGEWWPTEGRTILRTCTLFLMFQIGKLKIHMIFQDL